MSDEKLKALKKQLDALNDSIMNLYPDGSKTIAFGAYARIWLSTKRANPTLRDSTKRILTNQVVRHLIPAFHPHTIDEITNAVFLQWVTEYRKIKPNFKFFNSLKYLKAILLDAKNTGIIDHVPKFDNPDQKQDIGRILSDSEVIQILWKSHKPFRFMFYCFWKTGCRPHEICQWQFEMIKGEWIDIPARISKTNRKRRIPMHKGILRIISHKKTDTSFVFPTHSYSNEWNRAVKKAGIKAVPYDLRRSFITRCVSEGKSPIFIAKLLDTSAKLIEEKYCKNDEQTLRDLLK